jgi:hypothetical protein
MVDAVRAGSWNELIDLLFEGSWNDDLRRFRSPFAYRGIANQAYELETGLRRLSGRDTETHLLRNFVKYARRTVDLGDSVWNWLAVGQHYGLPTRLLDFSFSPLVALHFVTADLEEYTADGVVWAVDFRQTNRRLPERLRRVLEVEGSDVFSAEMLESAADSLPALERLASEPFLVFLEPPSLDDRIVNQAALFALLSSARASPGAWLAEHPEATRRVVVPAELKWEVRDRLDQMNVTERVLFPGLEGLSAWLRRYYWPTS